MLDSTIEVEKENLNLTIKNLYSVNELSNPYLETKEEMPKYYVRREQL